MIHHMSCIFLPNCPIKMASLLKGRHLSHTWPSLSNQISWALLRSRSISAISKYISHTTRKCHQKSNWKTITWVWVLCQLSLFCIELRILVTPPGSDKYHGSGFEVFAFQSLHCFPSHLFVSDLHSLLSKKKKSLCSLYKDHDIWLNWNRKMRSLQMRISSQNYSKRK